MTDCLSYFLILLISILNLELDMKENLVMKIVSDVLDISLPDAPPPELILKEVDLLEILEPPDGILLLQRVLL